MPIWQVSLAFWVLFLAVLAAHALELGNVAQITTFGVIFASIVIEAMPFILLWALVSAAVAVFVPDRVFARIGRLPRRLQLPGATLRGRRGADREDLRAEQSLSGVSLTRAADQRR